MSKKDYRQGMSDAMAAYEAFGEKQEAAIQHVGAEIEKTAGKVDRLGRKIGEIADYITDKEKAALYKLNTPVDIADLEDAEKRILLAVLYQLSADEDEVTEEQQNYVRAVQKYLKIYNPQTEIDLSAVENIEDISVQKAVLQSALEFFRLGTYPEDLTEEQEDFLDYFQVNRKTHREISSFIDAIVDAVGIKGLSEKYGFVANQPRSEFAAYKDNGPIPEKTADACIRLLWEKGSKFSRFANNLYFLEANDYLFCCADTCVGIFAGRISWEGDEAKELGLFRIDKQTGEINRININYKKDFPFANAHSLHFAVYHNTVYALERPDNYNDKRPTASLIMIDLEHDSYQVIPFAVPVDYYGHFHLSANDKYLMVHSYKLKGGYNKPVSTDTYVIDLTQDYRVFSLNHPKLTVKDAFILGDEFILSGCMDHWSPCSLYRYSLADQSIQEMFPHLEKEDIRHSIGYELDKTLLGNTSGISNRTSNDNLVYHNIWRVKDSWYILAHYEKTDNFKNTWFYFRIHRATPDSEKYMIQKIFDGSSSGISRAIQVWHGDRYAFLFDGDMTTYKYEFNIDEKPVGIGWGCPCDLLGDYLYVKQGDEIKKTNLSNGFDNLQWEIFQI